MFITRFTKNDNKRTTEDYIYNTEKEAKNHLMLFADDDSGLYRNISVLDDRNYVLHILPFSDGKPMDIISHGSKVKLRPEYSSAEEIESDNIFIVSDINEWAERLSITCLTTDMIFRPKETVGVEMVQPCTDDI